jgi:hypothetical protein
MNNIGANRLTKIEELPNEAGTFMESQILQFKSPLHKINATTTE